MKKKKSSRKNFLRLHRLFKLQEVIYNDLVWVGMRMKLLNEFIQILRVKQQQRHKLIEFSRQTKEVLDKYLLEKVCISAVVIKDVLINNKKYDMSMEARWLGTTASKILIAEKSEGDIQLSILSLLTHESGLEILESLDFTTLCLEDGNSLSKLIKKYGQLHKLARNEVPLWQA